MQATSPATASLINAWKNGCALSSPVPRLMLSTFACCWIAYATPSASADRGMSPVESFTLSGMIFEPHATPAMPPPLFVAAPARPAQNVPCQPSSTPSSGSNIGSGSGLASSLPKSQPFTSST